MPDNQDEKTDSGSGNWLDTIVEAGLPQVLAGPAGKAISRLIGASVEIPAAYLERFSQGVRDGTEARSIVTRAIAEQASEMAVADPFVMERAMNSMLSKSYRAQINKDEVAKVAIEDLANKPPSDESEGPDDVWLDKFELYAEEASSDSIRTTFGKILASEIRSPGTVSLPAMQLISTLDPLAAKLISRVLKVCYGGASGELAVGFALLDALDPKLDIVQKSELEHAGFLSLDKTISPVLDGQGRYQVSLPNSRGFVVIGIPNTQLNVKVGALSRAGVGLMLAISPEIDEKAISEVFFQNPKVSGMQWFTQKEVDGKTEIVDFKIYKNEAFEATK